MPTSRNESITASAEQASEPSRDIARPSRNPLAAIRSTHRRGAGSLVNLSLYAAGFSGLWTAFGSAILPIKIDEIVAGGGSTILGITFDSDDKNGAIGIVSLLGLAIAALTQPIAGVLSDRRTGPGKRMPFLLIGAIGMAASAMFLGIAGTLIALIVLNLLIQGMGNFGQGAANGLIADHVKSGSKGAAAGALNLSRIVGAGVMAAIVLLMMGQYDADTAPGWMIAALVLLATVTMLTNLWTVTSVWRNREAADAEPTPEPQQEEIVPDASPVPHDNYLRFLIALTVVITGFSALQLYAFFYLEDVIGLENPAQGGVFILGSISLATAITVLPAGHLTDRIGRDSMLVTGGVLGVIASTILIFATSLLVVVLVGFLIGAAIGIFLTVSWALANDLVSRKHAARDLGYASVAVLIGSAISRIAGIGVDRLNQVQDALGYQTVLGTVAVCFIVTVALMTRLGAESPAGASEGLPEQAARE